MCCLAPMPNVLGASTMNTVNTVNCLDREYRECRELPQFLDEVDREFHDFRTISGRGRIVGSLNFNCWSPWYLALVPCPVPRLPKIKMSSTNNSIFWTTVGTKAWYNCWSTVGTNALIVGLYRKLSMKPHILTLGTYRRPTIVPRVDQQLYQGFDCWFLAKIFE